MRKAAQRLLTDHLEPGTASFWEGQDIDLSLALLVDFLFIGCSVRRADFAGSVFAGAAQFGGMKASDNVYFSGARFMGDAWFTGAHFGGNVFYDNTTFDAAAIFCGVDRTAGLLISADMEKAQLGDFPVERGASFERGAYFDDAVFASPPHLSAVTINGPCSSDGARISSSGWLRWSRSSPGLVLPAGGPRPTSTTGRADAPAPAPRA